ncbi:MAG: ribonuclease J [Aeriscardovia aeriphila]|nr:ribonuclease J [Aeriscardovia aeriphila]
MKPLPVPNENQVPKDDSELVAPPKYRRGSMRIVALGGLGEIGRNMNTIEYNGHLLLIDCGVLFPDSQQPGVDLILPDFSYIRPRLNKVDALVLTHGHEDHIGAVPYLLRERPDIPLYGSSLTLAFVQAKCEEFGIKPICHVVDDKDTAKVGPFNLEFISVTHSIPDALAVAVSTPAGRLIDTGDFKIDPLPIDHRITDLREFAKQGEKGVDLLMADSTNAEIKGFVKPESSITPALDHAFATARRKIIVASFSSHVHRVQQVVDVAHKYGRKVVFVGRSMVRNMGIAADLGFLKLPEDTVVDLRDAQKIPDTQLVYMCTGSQGEPLAALGRIANGNHPTIQVNEFDTVILASSLIPGNESEVYRVINQLTSLGAQVINRDNAAIHVSGHADEGELLYLYNIVQPKNAMPIHGESRHQVANGLIAIKTGVDPQNVVLARDGDVVDLYQGKAAIVGSVPCHYVYVDGSSVGELTDEELEKRKILGTEGFVSSFVVVDTRINKVVKGPRIFLNAVAEDEEEFAAVRDDVTDTLERAMQDGTTDTGRLQQVMRRTLGSWIARELHRRPMIVPVVTDLAVKSKK